MRWQQPGGRAAWLGWILPTGHPCPQARGTLGLPDASDGLASSSREWLGLELSNWIASCLLLKGLCIPLSINLFMAHG